MCALHILIWRLCRRGRLIIALTNTIDGAVLRGRLSRSLNCAATVCGRCVAGIDMEETTDNTLATEVGVQGEDSFVKRPPLVAFSFCFLLGKQKKAAVGDRTDPKFLPRIACTAAPCRSARSLPSARLSLRSEQNSAMMIQMYQRRKKLCRRQDCAAMPD